MTGFRQFGAKLDIVSQSYVRVFSAGTFDRHWYPYRLEKVGSASDRVRNNCMEYILDSNIGDPSITNADVLEKAADLNPTYVIPKDYLPFDAYPTGRWKDGGEKEGALDELKHEYDDNVEATTDSIGEFVDLWEDAGLSCQPLIPLQPPYIDHYQTVTEKYGQFSHFSLGGMKSSSTANQLDAVDDFLDWLDWNPYIHVLGVGANLGFIRKVQLDPKFRQFVNSVDLSTAEQYGRNGNFADKSWIHKRFHLANGKNRSTLTALQADLALVHLNHMLGPYCWDDLIDEDPDLNDFDEPYAKALERVMDQII